MKHLRVKNCGKKSNDFKADFIDRTTLLIVVNKRK